MRWLARRADIDRAITCANIQFTPELETPFVPQQAHQALLAKAIALSEPENILLVEDEPLVLNAMAESLRSAGYKVLMASSGALALNFCRKHRLPDLLITDLVMPGMSGRELAIAFKALCPRSRVLLMTGYAEEISRHELPSGVHGCLKKPFSASTLLQTVREILNTNAVTSAEVPVRG